MCNKSYRRLVLRLCILLILCNLLWYMYKSPTYVSSHRPLGKEAVLIKQAQIKTMDNPIHRIAFAEEPRKEEISERMYDNHVRPDSEDGTLENREDKSKGTLQRQIDDSMHLDFGDKEFHGKMKSTRGTFHNQSMNVVFRGLGNKELNDKTETSRRGYQNLIEESLLPSLTDTKLNYKKDTPTQTFHNRNNTPVRHVVFIKVPKAASTTVGNIFLRFGDEMNLTFAIPHNGSGGYLLTPKYYHLPPTNATYDIACAHAKYNRTDYNKYFPRDTRYIAIIREPFSHFRSYIRFFRPEQVFNITGENPVLTFLSLSVDYRNKTDRVEELCNWMARYFGFPPKIFFKKRNQTQIDIHFQKLETEIDFVMIYEFLDESIVMMRRLLHWELRHVLYGKLNVNRKNDPRLKFGLNVEKLHKNCAFLDYRVYEFFLRKWRNNLERQSPDFQDEVAFFKKTRMKYEHFCLLVRYKNYTHATLTIEGSAWNKPFTITELDCRKLYLDFIKFSQMLLHRQMTS